MHIGHYIVERVDFLRVQLAHQIIVHVSAAGLKFLKALGKEHHLVDRVKWTRVKASCIVGILIQIPIIVILLRVQVDSEVLFVFTNGSIVIIIFFSHVFLFFLFGSDLHRFARKVGESFHNVAIICCDNFRHSYWNEQRAETKHEPLNFEVLLQATGLTQNFRNEMLCSLALLKSLKSC